MMKMKIALLLSFTALFFVAAHAQTEKGKLLVGASTSNLGFQTGHGATAYGFQLRPNAGLFILDNFTVGLRLIYGQSYSKAGIGPKYFSSNFAYGVFGRYYIPLTQRLKLPIEVELGNGFTLANSISNFRGASFRATALAGLSIFVAQNISFDLMAGYGASESLGIVKNHFGQLVGNVGVSLYLNSKSKK